MSCTRNLNFFISNQYLFILLPSRNAGTTQADQCIPHAFLLCMKKDDPQTFKSGSIKNSFLQCACAIGTTCFVGPFLFYLKTGRNYFS